MGVDKVGRATVLHSLRWGREPGGGSQASCPAQQWDASGRILGAAQAKSSVGRLDLTCFSKLADCFLSVVCFGTHGVLYATSPLPVQFSAQPPGTPAPALVVSNLSSTPSPSAQPLVGRAGSASAGACWEESSVTRNKCAGCSLHKGPENTVLALSWLCPRGWGADLFPIHTQTVPWPSVMHVPGMHISAPHHHHTPRLLFSAFCLHSGQEGQRWDLGCGLCSFCSRGGGCCPPRGPVRPPAPPQLIPPRLAPSTPCPGNLH